MSFCGAFLRYSSFRGSLAEIQAVQYDPHILYPRIYNDFFSKFFLSSLNPRM